MCMLCGLMMTRASRSLAPYPCLAGVSFLIPSHSQPLYAPHCVPFFIAHAVTRTLLYVASSRSNDLRSTFLAIKPGLTAPRLSSNLLLLCMLNFPNRSPWHRQAPRPANPPKLRARRTPQRHYSRIRERPRSKERTSDRGTDVILSKYIES